MKRIFIIGIFLMLLAGCSGEPVQEDKFTVYTSFYGMYDFTRMIAGDKADIYELIPAGVEAHDWEPGTEDMIGISNADVFVYSGMDMEPWAEKIIESAGNEKLIAVEASKGIEPLEEGKNTDPHVWLNPQNALIQMENITQALCEADSENAQIYRGNLENVRKKIEELDKKFKEATDTFEDKEIIVTHGAFGYLCSAYGLNQYAIEGLTGESDPSSSSMREIIDYMNNNNKKSLFYVKAEGDKLAEAIASETGAQIFELNPFEGDAEGKDYFEVMNENLENMKEALGGNEE